MSIILKDSEKYTADKLFETRQIFKETSTKYISPRQAEAVVDMRSDMPFYGRFYKGTVYFPDQQYLVEIPKKNVSYMFVQDFVRDAFINFDAYYTKALLTKRIKKTGPLSSLQPVETYISPNYQYDNHLNRLKGLFLEYIHIFHKDKKIENVVDLAKLFIIMLAERKGEIFFSKEKYMLSELCVPFTSGLSIKLGEFDYNDDVAKYNELILDKNFSFFVEGARRFGFFIDITSPWVIHFDFNSQYSQDTILKKIDLTEEKFYKERCIPAHDAGIDNLKTFLYICYSQFLGDINKNNIYYSVPVGITERGSVQLAKRERHPVFNSTINNDQRNDFWSELYFEVRMLEEDIKLEQFYKNKFSLDIAKIREYALLNKQDPNPLIAKTINKFINKNKYKITYEKAKTF